MLNRTCTFLDCVRPRRYQDLCDSHKWQQRNGIELRPIRAKRRRAERHNPLTDEFQCRSCADWKPRSEFREDNGRAGNVSSDCLTCGRRRSAASAKVNTDSKRDWINAYKLSKGCADCGYSKHPAGLDFDHLPDFEKSFTISHMTASKPLVELQDEIRKCEVVCATCHRVRTSTRRLASL